MAKTWQKELDIGKYVRGQLVKLSAREVREEIQRLSGLTGVNYKREYNRVRNRAINYARLTGAKINVQEVWLRDLRKKSFAQRAGKQYVREGEYKIIFETSGLSGSTGRALKTEQATPAVRAALAASRNKILNDFADFVTKSNIGKTALADLIKKYGSVDNIPPDVLNATLSAAANDVHARQQLELAQNEAYYKAQGNRPGSY